MEAGQWAEGGTGASSTKCQLSRPEASSRVLRDLGVRRVQPRCSGLTNHRGHEVVQKERSSTGTLKSAPCKANTHKSGPLTSSKGWQQLRAKDERKCVYATKETMCMKETGSNEVRGDTPAGREKANRAHGDTGGWSTETSSG